MKPLKYAVYVYYVVGIQLLVRILHEPGSNVILLFGFKLFYLYVDPVCTNISCHILMIVELKYSCKPMILT